MLPTETRLLLKYIVDLPVNQIWEFFGNEMAPPLSKAVLLQKLTTAIPVNVMC